MNAVVRFEVSARTTVVMLEGVGGYVPVWPMVPGLFTADGSGAGQLAALNEDGITLNSTASPAKAGSVVAVFMTGAGPLTPPIADGKPGSLQLPFRPCPATATVNGIQASLQFIGQAPGSLKRRLEVQFSTALPPAPQVSLTW
ncbi:MAG: hypothetical protein ACREP9_14530 [Candidatus Dormibacteraceae bacterium]